MTEQCCVTVLIRKQHQDERERKKLTHDTDPRKLSYLPHIVNRPFPHGLVMDHYCTHEFLSLLNDTRINLPLDSKRPTCDRRFFCDQDRTIVSILESVVKKGLLESFGNDGEIVKWNGITDDESNDVNDNNKMHTIFVNKYLRILEYTRPGVELLPHSDGSKVCDETAIQSTHTLLLFLSNCEEGGETLLMDGCNNEWSKQKRLVLDSMHRFQHPTENESGSYRRCVSLDRLIPNDHHVILGVQPIVGRIFVFPHHWAHAGAICQSVPKIALRAEITIFGFHE